MLEDFGARGDIHNGYSPYTNRVSIPLLIVESFGNSEKSGVRISSKIPAINTTIPTPKGYGSGFMGRESLGDEFASARKIMGKWFVVFRDVHKHSYRFVSVSLFAESTSTSRFPHIIEQNKKTSLIYDDEVDAKNVAEAINNIVALSEL